MNAQDNIRQLLLAQVDENNIDPMDILSYANAEDEVCELIHETLGRLSNDDLSDAITRILANKQEQEVIDAYIQKALTAVQDYIRDNDVFEVCDKLGITL